MTDSDPILIANCSGFFGDRHEAAREIVEGGPIHFLTGDYLAELTLLILRRTAERGSPGYVGSFLSQMHDVLAACAERGIRVVTNAGGLNPAALADEVRSLVQRLGLKLEVAHIEGDDLLPRIGGLKSNVRHLAGEGRLSDLEMEPINANAYLGAWGIVKALDRGADIVIAPRVTDASLTVGPAASHFHWAMDDWNRLAGAMVAGHLIECGAQVTGGNFSFFQEVPGLTRLGYPIAEVRQDGSAVITKHQDAGGIVTTETVTAQLLYEIGGHHYVGPDVVADLRTISLERVGADRILISGTKGRPPPIDLKVAVHYPDGYQNSMTVALTGLDIEAKADLMIEGLMSSLSTRNEYRRLDTTLLRSDHPNSRSNDGATAYLSIEVEADERQRVDRAFSDRVIELLLASVPGIYTTSPPTRAREIVAFWPGLIDRHHVIEEVVFDDGERSPVKHPPTSNSVEDQSDSTVTTTYDMGSTVRIPLGRLVGARSGDKGSDANLGVWVRADEAFEWLNSYLTVDRVATLLPETQGLRIDRYTFDNLRAMNFVIHGLLGRGAAASNRSDKQAKSLAEWLRSRVIEVPTSMASN